MECEFCKSILRTQATLNTHIKSNKHCLALRARASQEPNIVTSLVNCEFCQNSFAKTNIYKHRNICKFKDRSRADKLECEQERILRENNELRIENEILKRRSNEYDHCLEELAHIKSENEQFKLRISALEAENALYSQDHKVKDKLIVELAHKPTSNVVNNKITNNITVFNDDVIKSRITNAMSTIAPSDLYDGQQAIARIVAPCLENDDGTKMMACTDYSRGIFTLRDQEGNLVKDIKCLKFVDLVEPIASAKADEIFREECGIMEKRIQMPQLRRYVDDRIRQIEKAEISLRSCVKGSDRWLSLTRQIHEWNKENDANMAEFRRLERELQGVPPSGGSEPDMVNPKLVDGVTDIKNLSRDSSKFSKALSERI